MTTVNSLLADAATSHAVDLSQYSNGVVRRLIKLLGKADSELSAALEAALQRMPAESFTVERLELLLHSVRAINVQAYKTVELELTKELRHFVEYESTYQYDLYAHSIPSEIQKRFLVARVSTEQVYAAALSRPFQGRLLAGWAANLEDSRMVAVRNAIRVGYVNGKTTAQIVQSIRGTRANQYADGVLNRSRRDVQTVVHTAISHTAEVARENFQSANADLVKATQWLSTLDSKTTEICRVRDGKRYTVDTHRPIGHSLPWLGGPGKAHWNCRSASVPVLKSWRELGFKLGELSHSTRASMDGQVSAELNYGDWLQRQSYARQIEILGPMRAKLMRDGAVPLDKMYTPTGHYLTLDELRTRDAASFRRAGL